MPERLYMSRSAAILFLSGKVPDNRFKRKSSCECKDSSQPSIKRT